MIIAKNKQTILAMVIKLLSLNFLCISQFEHRIYKQKIIIPFLVIGVHLHFHKSNKLMTNSWLIIDEIPRF